MKDLKDYTQGQTIAELPFLSKLILQLELLNWENLEETIPKVGNILTRTFDEIESFKIELASISESQYSEMISRSYDLSSHRKFFLYKSEEQRFSIWINHFKAERISGFANSIHNHRYHFASIPLKGGFVQNSHDGLSSKILKTEVIEQGKAYYVLANEVHSFEVILPETVTLLVRTRAYFPYSESFDEQTESIRKHYSLASHFQHFKKILK